MTKGFLAVYLETCILYTGENDNRKIGIKILSKSISEMKKL